MFNTEEIVSSNFKWVYVIGGILFSSLAQIFMKRATAIEGKIIFWVPYILGSMSCYILSFLAYYLALKYFTISKVSPIMTVGVVLIVVFYGVWSGESVSFQHAVGMMLGVISIYLILS